VVEDAEVVVVGAMSLAPPIWQGDVCVLHKLEVAQLAKGRVMQSRCVGTNGADDGVCALRSHEVSGFGGLRSGCDGGGAGAAREEKDVRIEVVGPGLTGTRH
jgi:hypothetical protein